MTLEELCLQVACARLPVAYCWAFDTRDTEALVDLFSPDATWQRPSGETLVGRAQIRASFERPPPGPLRHIASNVMVWPLGAQAAAGRSLATVYRLVEREGATPLLPAPLHVVEYSDRYLQDTSGRWRIAQRRTSKVMVQGP